MNVVVVGSCNLDLIVEVPQLPTPGQTMLGGDVAIRPGGKGANQAVAARRLGAPTAFVGAVGDDQFGATLHKALGDEDVDLTGLATVAGQSGVALVVVDPRGENFITVASGANRRLGPEHLDGLAELLTPSAVLLMQLEIPVRTCLAAARVARTAGARVVLNAAPIPELDEAELAVLLEHTDVLVANEGEARALCPQPGDDWPALAAALCTLGPGAAVVTRGEAGAVLADAGATLAVPAHAVTAVDTTGAGDAFCGALAASLAAGATLVDAVERGCLAGALATTAVGAQTALPSAADLAAIAARVGD